MICLKPENGSGSRFREGFREADSRSKNKHITGEDESKRDVHMEFVTYAHSIKRDIESLIADRYRLRRKVKP